MWVVSVNIAKFLINTYFEERLRTAASLLWNHQKSYGFLRISGGIEHLEMIPDYFFSIDEFKFVY